MVNKLISNSRAVVYIFYLIRVVHNLITDGDVLQSLSDRSGLKSVNYRVVVQSLSDKSGERSDNRMGCCLECDNDNGVG